ncbi:MAG: DUF1573 domain-containing protein [Bacteroidales bacterium]|nr:DUF1573 domain-containing protein [Bacteroidales bacterium]
MFRFLLTVISIIVLSYFIGCTNSQSKGVNQNISNQPNNQKYPELQYVEDFFDFGSIIQGEVVTHTFHFRNIGTDDLIIKDLIPDCGCTLPKIDKKIFKPGEEGFVEVIFDSKGWQGSQYKSVTLRSNSIIREKSVTIKANVVPHD